MPLAQIAAVLQQRIQLFPALDALGQHAHLKHAPKIEDGLQNRRLLTRNRQVGDQAAVDLHQVNRQADEVVHGGQAGAEVIQGGADFQISHALKNRKRALRILIHRSLGHFEAQLSRGNLPFGQQLGEIVQQIEDP